MLSIKWRFLFNFIQFYSNINDRIPFCYDHLSESRSKKHQKSFYPSIIGYTLLKLNLVSLPYYAKNCAQNLSHYNFVSISQRLWRK